MTETVIGEPEAVTRGSRSILWFDVAPDGSRFVFCETFPQEDLITIRADGTGGEFRVTDDLARDRRPRWSPDGARIAMYSDRDGEYDLWTLDPDDGAPVRHTDSLAVFGFTWSPDGARLLAFVQQRPGGVPAGGYAVDATKSFDEQTPMPLPAPAEMAAPFHPAAWSPDGRRVAGFADTNTIAGGGVWLYTFETESYEQLTDSGRDPRWLADSNRLVYARAGEIWLVNAESGETKVFSRAVPTRHASPTRHFGDWMPCIRSRDLARDSPC